MPPRNMLPQALMANGNPQALRDFYAMQAVGAMSEDIDPTPFIEEQRRQRESGQGAMLNALAAQYAGQDFQPLQGMLLKRAMAARDPVQVGNAGYVNERGQFIKAPGYDQGRKAQLSQTLSQIYGQRYSDQLAAANRAEDRADRLANREPFSMVADPVNGGMVIFDKRTGTYRPADGAAPPRPASGPTGFPNLPPGIKIPEASNKNLLGASLMAEQLPKLEQLVIGQGFVPSKVDLFASGPQLPGWQSTLQGITPREMSDPRAQQFFEAGSKILTGILRPESGGAITSDEWTQYGPMYLPWPGDSPELRQTKIAGLRNYMNRLGKTAGPAGRYFEGPAASAADDGVIDLPAPGGPR